MIPCTVNGRPARLVQILPPRVVNGNEYGHIRLLVVFGGEDQITALNGDYKWDLRFPPVSASGGAK